MRNYVVLKTCTADSGFFPFKGNGLPQPFARLRNDKIIKLFNSALRIPNSALLFKFFVKILKQPYSGNKSKLKINVFKPCFPIRYFAEKFFLLFGVGEILV